MDVLNLLKSRRSIRKYKDSPVEEEKINKCLEAARWAPSASNKQPWEFMIVKKKETRTKLAKMHPYGKFIADSPVVFIPLTDPRIHQDYHQSDTSLATIQFMIMAHSLGLGTCWAGVINKPTLETEIKELLNIPDELHVLALVSLGYPAHTRESNRKSFDSLIHYEKY